MPHVPDFPSPSEDVDEDGREPDRRSIIDRIIGGEYPTVAGSDPLPQPDPAR